MDAQWRKCLKCTKVKSIDSDFSPNCFICVSCKGSKQPQKPPAASQNTMKPQGWVLPKGVEAKSFQNIARMTSGGTNASNIQNRINGLRVNVDTDFTVKVQMPSPKAGSKIINGREETSFSPSQLSPSWNAGQLTPTSYPQTPHSGHSHSAYVPRSRGPSPFRIPRRLSSVSDFAFNSLIDLPDFRLLTPNTRAFEYHQALHVDESIDRINNVMDNLTIPRAITEYISDAEDDGIPDEARSATGSFTW